MSVCTCVRASGSGSVPGQLAVHRFPDAESYRGLGIPTRELVLGPDKKVVIASATRNSFFWGQFPASGIWGWEAETQSAFEGEPNVWAGWRACARAVAGG